MTCNIQPLVRDQICMQGLLYLDGAKGGVVSNINGSIGLQVRIKRGLVQGILPELLSAH